jgi:hypothetical protein
VDAEVAALDAHYGRMLEGLATPPADVPQWLLLPLKLHAQQGAAAEEEEDNASDVEKAEEGREGEGWCQGGAQEHGDGQQVDVAQLEDGMMAAQQATVREGSCEHGECKDDGSGQRTFQC